MTASEHLIGESLASARLRLAGSDSAQLDAEILLGFVTGMDRAALYAHPGRLLSEAQAAVFQSLVSERSEGMPVAYLTGTREFWSLDFTVSPDVLVPRPETELLVERALEMIPEDTPMSVADLGTGSGCIAIAIASERPDCSITATDRSPAALSIARLNAAANNVRSIEFTEANWCQGLAGESFDLIVCNPPYVRAQDPLLLDSDIRHEPVSALAAGDDGLDDLRTLAETLPLYLTHGGTALLEHGADQGPAIRGLLARRGFGQVRTWRDAAGHERLTGAVRDQF